MELISKEDALMCLTGEYLEGEEYKYDEIIHRFIQRLQSVPTVPAVPMSVIEGIKAKLICRQNIYENSMAFVEAARINVVLDIIDDVLKEYAEEQEDEHEHI